MNFEAIKSIYGFEMARTRRTLLQSVARRHFHLALFSSFSVPRSDRASIWSKVFPMGRHYAWSIMLTRLANASARILRIYFPSSPDHLRGAFGTRRHE